MDNHGESVCLSVCLPVCLEAARVRPPVNKVFVFGLATHVKPKCKINKFLAGSRGGEGGGPSLLTEGAG